VTPPTGSAVTWPVHGLSEARQLAGKLGVGQVAGALLAPDCFDADAPPARKGV